MKIKWKMLCLMIPMTLIPALLVVAINRSVLQRTQVEVAHKTYELVSQDAEESLLTIVTDFTRSFNQSITSLLFTLENQANEIDRIIKAPPSTDLPKVYVYGVNSENMPADTQVFYIMPDIKPEAVRRRMFQMTAMNSEYRRLKKLYDGAITSQYTAFTDGLHCSFPGAGKEFPDSFNPQKQKWQKFDPRIRKWFQEARKLKKAEWIVMDDVITCDYVVTAIAPLRNEKSEFIGATCIDVNLEALLNNLNLPESWSHHAQVMLAKVKRTQKGEPIQIILHNCRRRNKVFYNPQGLDKLADLNPQQYDRLKALMKSGKDCVVRMPFVGEDSFWAFGAHEPGEVFPLVIVPRNVVTSDADQAVWLISDSTKETLRYSAYCAGPLLILAVIAAGFLSHRITLPINKLVEGAHKIANGNFSTKVNIKSHDEFSRLGEVFNEIGPKLHEREQMKHSLFLASEVQHSLLPESSPKVQNFDIYGRSDYCDETGGDYFDFIPLADGELGVTIGDITGHGIEAALLMATARAVIRSHAFHNDLPLGEMFKDINMHLVHDTGDARFMTLFFAILDPDGRKFKWVSCGHDPAMLLRSDSQTIEELDNRDILLGVIDGVNFHECGPIDLHAGDIVVIGTDGIWEARNPAGELFGKDRVKRLIVENRSLTALAIHHAIVKAVKEFCSTRPQEDDITLTVIKTMDN